MRRRIELVVLGATASISILISLLDWLDWLPPGAIRIPDLTLLALGLIAGYLVLERRSKLDNIERLVAEGPERIIRSLDGVDIRRLGSALEVYEYAAKRIGEAERAVDDLTFGFEEPALTPETEKARREYQETILRACSRRRRRILYREVMSFPPLSHVARAQFMLRKDVPGYRLRYYEFAGKHLPALLSFMVIDSSEVLLSFYRAPYLPSEREIRLAIKAPDIVKLFQDYYDAIWQGAEILREGDRVEFAVLQEIETRLRQTEDNC